MLNYYISISCKLFLKEIKGIENLPLQGGYILAANHISYLDIWVMYVTFLNKVNTYIKFIAKKSLLKDTFFRTSTFLFENKENKVIILDIENPEEAFREAVNALRKGMVIGIYPEGKRSLTGKLQKGRTGVTRLALAAKVPVVPVGIKGTFELMGSGKSIPKIKKSVILNIGKPIYFDGHYKKKDK